MDERERKRLLGAWGVRSENDRERREREVLERDLEGAPYRGQRVRLRPNPFGPATESYVTSLGGPLPYMARLRDIEAETTAHEYALAEAWQALAAELAGRPDAFARSWRARAERWNFVAVNELIERHNRWYPTEARLPMDLRTRDFALVNGEHYRRELLGPRWVLRRFPADLELATRRAA